MVQMRDTGFGSGRGLAPMATLRSTNTKIGEETGLSIRGVKAEIVGS